MPSVSASVDLQQRRLSHAGSLSLCECGAGHSTQGLIPTQLHIRLVPDLVFQEKFPGQILCQTMGRQKAGEMLWLHREVSANALNNTGRIPCVCYTMHVQLQGRAEGCDGDCGHWSPDQLLGIGTWNCALKAE